MNENRIPVGILGATGMVGQQFVKFLQNHPWFEIAWVGASDRSAGKPYREATSWRLDGAMPANVQRLEAQECKPVNAPRLVFSSMDASVATEIEREFAQAGHVVVGHARLPQADGGFPTVELDGGRPEPPDAIEGRPVSVQKHRHSPCVGQRD